MTAVTVSRRDDRLTAVKQVGSERAKQLEHEAQLLGRLRHPGILRFVALEETADGGRALHTEFVSSETWATRPLTVGEERAAAVAALAATVADLHDLGIAHMQISADHVLHGAGDRPVLCGLSRADEATPQNRRADTTALGALCYDDTVERGPLAELLATVGDLCKSAQIEPRELARQLEAQVKRRQPSQPDVVAEAAPRERNSRRRAALGAVAVIAVIVLGVRLAPVGGGTETTLEITQAPHDAAQGAPGASSEDGLTAPGEIRGPISVQAPSTAFNDDTAPVSAQGADAFNSTDASPDMPEVSDRTATLNNASPGVTPSVEQTTEHPGAQPSETPSVEQTTEDAGAQPSETPGVEETAEHPGAQPSVAELPAARIVEHQGRSYAIGVRGDLVALGDWDCDGVSTPAIVRPSTGSVALFNDWPAAGQTLSMTVRWRVDSPVDVLAEHHHDCDLLRIYTESGSRLIDSRSAP